MAYPPATTPKNHVSRGPRSSTLPRGSFTLKKSSHSQASVEDWPLPGRVVLVSGTDCTKEDPINVRRSDGAGFVGAWFKGTFGMSARRKYPESTTSKP